MKKNKNKRLIASVTNDLVTDARVHKVCTTLVNMGFDVLLTGRKLGNNIAFSKRPYSTHRFKLFFNKGIFFYAEMNIRLIFLLLFSRADVFLANDLDTLPAHFLASKLRKKPLVYDSHEYFTEVPELVNRPRVRRFWKWLEKKMVPHIHSAYTVCNSIANAYQSEYGVPFHVVRNLPLAYQPLIHAKENAPLKKIIYQGAVNMGRGLEQTIHAIKNLENVQLIIAGHGDIIDELKQLADREGLLDRIVFTGRLPFESLRELTATAHLGISLEEDLGLNYRYALPNKLFDYIQARVPVLVSNLPEMAAIVNTYKIGEIAVSLNPEKLAKDIEAALFSMEKRRKWKKNLEMAAKELTWENELHKVKEIFELL
ncbi:MAG: glycosyl transferase group 1 [Draconibacterium sp.]|nr:MAG: glycosyl transferase group 1 [Draconibacterium sp.]